MYDYNITAQEIADYNVDMIEIMAAERFLSEEEMVEMAAYYGEE